MSEAYSEPCQTSKTAFCENNLRLKAVDYFRKTLHHHFGQGSEHASDTLTYTLFINCFAIKII